MSFLAASDVCLKFFTALYEVSPFPPPLWGRGREGGTPRGLRVRGTPTPAPSPQGGGEHSVVR